MSVQMQRRPGAVSHNEEKGRMREGHLSGSLEVRKRVTKTQINLGTSQLICQWLTQSLQVPKVPMLSDHAKAGLTHASALHEALLQWN